MASVQLTYIGASWCSTCKTIKPALDQLCKKFSVPMKVLDYDKDLMDDEQAIVTKVPTVRIFQAEKMVAEFNVKQVASTEQWFSENVKLVESDDF
jgi:thiol-disulfide isomerase/thioredoxin